MTQNTPLSRRALLAISAAAGAATTVAASLPALAQANPDAELLRLDREHDLTFARALAYGASTTHWNDEEFNEICGAYTDLEFAIQTIPAQTWAGIVVKARIAAEYAERGSEGQVLDDIGPSLIEDILRIANVTSKRDTPRAPAEGGSDDGAV